LVLLPQPLSVGITGVGYSDSPLGFQKVVYTGAPVTFDEAVSVASDPGPSCCACLLPPAIALFQASWVSVLLPKKSIGYSHTGPSST
jgi:hypothetical protein